MLYMLNKKMVSLEKKHKLSTGVDDLVAKTLPFVQCERSLEAFIKNQGEFSHFTSNPS